MEAAQEALRKAEEGDQSRPPAIMPRPQHPVETGGTKWRDGTYTARTEFDDYGYYGEIELVIADGKISEVRYDEKTREGNPRERLSLPWDLNLRTSRRDSFWKPRIQKRLR